MGCGFHFKIGLVPSNHISVVLDHDFTPVYWLTSISSAKIIIAIRESPGSEPFYVRVNNYDICNIILGAASPDIPDFGPMNERIISALYMCIVNILVAEWLSKFLPTVLTLELPK